MCKDYDKFWQDIKHKNNSKAPLPNCIKGAHGSDNIVQLWHDHYKKLFNCVPSNPKEVLKNEYVAYNADVIVSADQIGDHIRSLQLNKSPGLDGLTAEHLKYASDYITDILGLCFSGMLTHGCFFFFFILFIFHN
jgi:hypothetical protein